MNNEEKNDYTLGLTIYRTQEIWLKETQANITKTLKHELTHVWLYEYGHNQNEKEFYCEDICKIVASSNTFINNVVEDFLNNKLNELTKRAEKLKEKINEEE